MKFILSLAALLLIAPTTWSQQTLVKYNAGRIWLKKAGCTQPCEGC